MTKFIALNIVLIMLFACNPVDRLEEVEIKNINNVKKIEANQIAKIEIYEKNNFVMMVDKRATLVTFAKSLKSLAKINPNHPDYIKKWHVIVLLKDNKKEELNFKIEKNDKIYLHVNCLGHSWFGSGGTAKSKDLYDWINSIGLIKDAIGGRPRP